MFVLFLFLFFIRYPYIIAKHVYSKRNGTNRKSDAAWAESNVKNTCCFFLRMEKPSLWQESMKPPSSSDFLFISLPPCRFDYIRSVRALQQVYQDGVFDRWTEVLRS